MNEKKEQKSVSEKYVLCESENEKFTVSPDGSLLWEKAKTGKDGEPYTVTQKIANHTPRVIRYRKVKGINGNTGELTIRFSYRNNDTVKAEERTLIADGLDTESINRVRPPEFYLEYGQGYKQAYARCINLQCGSMEVEQSYNMTGFDIVGGRLTYINRNYSINSDGIMQGVSSYFANDKELDRIYGFVHSNRPLNECYSTVLEELPTFISRDILIPSLGYVFLAPLMYFLVDSGILPAFSLYFVGHTGTGKTSFAKLLLNFMGAVRQDTPLGVSFQDTPNALERKLSLINDTVTLLDDRRPSTTKKDKEQFEEIEKRISILIGDRNGRGRLSQDSQSTIASFVPRCLLIVTGETAYENVGESAVARSISLEFLPGSVDISKSISFSHYEDLNVVMQEYIQYLIKSESGLTEKLVVRFEKFHDHISADHPRTRSNAAFILLGFSSFLDFMVDVQAITKEEREERFKEAVIVIQEVANHQTSVIDDEKPTNVFLNVLGELIRTNRVSVTPWGEKPENKSALNIGYLKADKTGNEIIILEPETTFNEVHSFLSKSGKTIIGMKALYKMLKDEGISICNKEGYYKTEHLPLNYGNGSQKFLEIPYDTLLNQPITSDEERR